MSIIQTEYGFANPIQIPDTDKYAKIALLATEKDITLKVFIHDKSLCDKEVLTTNFNLTSLFYNYSTKWQTYASEYYDKLAALPPTFTLKSGQLMANITLGRIIVTFITTPANTATKCCQN